MSGGLFVPNGCRLDQWHYRWIFLGNWPWDGDTSNFPPVLWAPSWWLMGPGIWGSILTWLRMLYVTLDYSCKVWDVSLVFLALTLQYLIPSHFFLVSISEIFSSSLWLQPPSLSLSPSCSLVLHSPTLSCQPPALPPQTALFLAHIWSLLGCVSCCWNHSIASSPLQYGPWGELVSTREEPQ